MAGTDEDWFWPFEPISKLNKTFCKYCTSIKFSTESMKVKQKQHRRNATVKHEVSIGLQHENCYLAGVISC